MRAVLFLLIAGTVCAAEVTHEPVSPKPGVTVIVTAKLPGVSKAVLKLQAVEPGRYIRKTDAYYEKDWIDLPMQKGDGAFTVTVPGSFQKHRWLLRYRIEFEQDGKPQRIPAKEDACPNFAWWCDAGPAAWTGSRDPGKSPAILFDTEFLKTLQSIHLIANHDDVKKSQWDGAFHKQRQQGTIIYRGLVYDHIQFSNRGQGSAHISGKNKWSLKFNKDHDLPFADHDGVPFPAPCDSLALNPGGSTPYLPVLRGITGLDEVLSMRAYRLAGVPSPPATWVQWRVVDRPNEIDTKDQYKSDLWGVYVAVGDMDPKHLADNKLPDGLVVSIQSGLKHTPAGMTDADKVWNAFIEKVRGNPPEAWWRENLNLQAYYSFHAMNRLLGNVDLRPDGNHGYYRRPDGLWSPIPWDNDMMFVPRQHQPGHIDAIHCLNHEKIKLEYRNRAREILDLFAADASPSGGQIGQMVHDLGGALTPANFKTDWARLDEAMWNQHPRMNQKGSWFVNPVDADHFGGRWKRTLATNDFAGFQKYLVDFCTDSRAKKNYAPNDGDPKGYGWGYLAYEARDDKIPATPKVTRQPGQFAFNASAFVSPAGFKAGGVEWRVGKVGQKGWYELTDHWRSEGSADMTIPEEVFKDKGMYRVRARWRDSTGRAGHWSPPITLKSS